MTDINKWQKFPRELLLDWNEPGLSFITVPSFKDGEIWRDNMFMAVDAECVSRSDEGECLLCLPDEVEIWSSSLLRFNRRELFKSDFDDVPTNITFYRDEAYDLVANIGQSYATYCSKTVIDKSSKLAFLKIPGKNIKDGGEFWSVTLPGDIIDIPKCAGIEKPAIPKRMYLETRERNKMGAIEIDDAFSISKR